MRVQANDRGSMSTETSILTNLLQTDNPGVLLSIYQPTHPASSGPTIQEDSTRFKNALQAIRLNDSYDTILDETMSTLDKLVGDVEFWKYRTLGLAIFADANGYEAVPLDYDVTEAYYIDEQYQVSPVVLLQSLGSSYYVLDINHTRPRLLEASSAGCTELIISGMPGSFESVTENIEYTKELQHQSGGTSGFHGHTDEAALQDDTMGYYRKISDAVDTHLSGHTEPLLFSGVQNRVGTMRQTLTYPHTLDEYIEGSNEEMNESEIHEKSIPIIELYNTQRRNDIITVFKETNPKLAITGDIDIKKAAEEGRVAKLLVPAFRQTTDTVREGYEPKIVLQLEEGNSTESLVRLVLSQGGDIVALSEDSFEDAQPRALCRY